MKKLKNDTPVIELQFAENYGCSRAALRGALTVLEQEGLICVMPNGTKKICSMSTEDINNLYELRTYVECAAARQILQKKSMDIARIIKVLEDADSMDFLDCDAKFHETLVASGRINVHDMVTHTFTLDEFPKALEFFKSKDRSLIKAVVEMDR